MVVAFGLCLWLLACSIFDLKWREVPATLSLPFLFTAVLWQALSGQFVLALFVVLLFIMADIPVRSQGFASGLQVSLFCLGMASSPEPVLSGINMVAMLTIWTTWRLEKMGGADVQVLLTLLLLLGPAVLLPIAAAGGIQGLVSLLAHKKSMPFMVSILAGTCLFCLLQPPIF